MKKTKQHRKYRSVVFPMAQVSCCSRPILLETPRQRHGSASEQLSLQFGDPYSRDPGLLSPPMSVETSQHQWSPCSDPLAMHAGNYDDPFGCMVMSPLGGPSPTFEHSYNYGAPSFAPGMPSPGVSPHQHAYMGYPAELLGGCAMHNARTDDMSSFLPSPSSATSPPPRHQEYELPRHAYRANHYRTQQPQLFPQTQHLAAQSPVQGFVDDSTASLPPCFWWNVDGLPNQADSQPCSPACDYRTEAFPDPEDRYQSFFLCQDEAQAGLDGLMIQGVPGSTALSSPLSASLSPFGHSHFNASLSGSTSDLTPPPSRGAVDGGSPLRHNHYHHHHHHHDNNNNNNAHLLRPSLMRHFSSPSAIASPRYSSSSISPPIPAPATAAAAAPSPLSIPRRMPMQRTFSAEYFAAAAAQEPAPAAATPASRVGFVNFTPHDGRKILTGVAPSGSSKTKARREKEAAEKRRRLSLAAARAILEAGGDVAAFEREGLFI